MTKKAEMNQKVFQPALLDTLSFRDEILDAETECTLHAHSFGQLI
ncbi:hypothetical protein [Xenorhabdus littoralis]|nr:MULTISPECIES: hypothetical protein [unclassified Xenorhabdus]